jgi:predicted phage replisome organizer
MAKTKNKIYFWLKVDKKFFDNLFIKRLKNVPGGYTMIVIYIRLMLESLESDCILYYEGYFETLKEELALKLDVSEDEIDMTMAYFTKCGLIQFDGENNAKMEQAEALVQQETNQAAYMRQYRKAQKEKQGNLTMLSQNPTLLNSCKTEIEKEKEKEIDIKKDINIDIKKEVEADNKKNSATADNQSDFNIFDYYQNRIGVLDGFQMEKLQDYIDIDGLETMLVKRAIDRAADNSKRSFGYINAILKKWAQNGIKTVVQQNEEQRNFEVRKNSTNTESEINEEWGF